MEMLVAGAVLLITAFTLVTLVFWQCSLRDNRLPYRGKRIGWEGDKERPFGIHKPLLPASLSMRDYREDRTCPNPGEEQRCVDAKNPISEILTV